MKIPRKHTPLNFDQRRQHFKEEQSSFLPYSGFSVAKNIISEKQTEVKLIYGFGIIIKIILTFQK